jgi:hypothetical protein
MERREFLAGTAAGAFAITLAWPGTAEAKTGDTLLDRFRSPGPEARPHTWWHWMNGNVTADGITRDLEAMARVGVGGAHMFDVGCGIPQGPATTLGPEWAKMIRHAADECGRLGLSLTLHNCPGWSSSGGPWITPERSMQQLVWSEATVEGGAQVDRVLPRPFTRLDHYRDAMVIAYPALPGDRAIARGHVVRATLNGAPADVRLITDGDAATMIDITPGDGPAHLVMEFAEPYAASALVLQASPVEDNANFLPSAAFTVEASDDGKNWRTLAETPVPVWRLHTTPPLIASFPSTTARFFRIGVPATCRLSELKLSADPRIANLGAKAGWGRDANVGEMPGAAEPAATIDPARVIDVSRFMESDGRLRWTPPAGQWTVLRFGHTATGANNLSASTAGIGLECDKFSAAALDFHFATYFRELLPALERLGRRDLAGVLIDSYETGMQNWTAEMPREFQARRGYALTSFMPAMTGRLVGSPEITERFLWDIRRAQALMMEELYFGRFHELCHQHGLTSYTEPYGNGPFDDQQAGAKVDALMGEFWVRGGAAAYSVKVAATTAHVHGKNFVGAESFTGRPAQSRWQEHPYAMKGLGDEMYTLGLNHFVFHRYAQQPHPTARPGMTMGPWGFHFDRTNTWFEEAGPWLAYVGRCQHMLSQGNFAADILYFAGENSPVQCPVHIEEPVAATLSGARPALAMPVPPGHDYDVCGAEVLHKRARIESNHIVLPDGMQYRVLVMPDDQRITRETLARIAELVRAGMWLVGAPVAQSHGLDAYPDSDAEVKRLAADLWGDLDGKAHTSRAYGRGRIFWGVSLDRVLAEAGLGPDVELSSRNNDAVLHWIHRRTADADIYFVSNARRRAETLAASFRVTGRAPECWDPMTGETHALPLFTESGGRTRVALHLDEAGSCFVVFRKPAAAAAAAPALRGAGTTLLQTGAYPAAPRDDAAERFTVSAWIKPETDLWPISPEIASDSSRPTVVAARAIALARGGSIAMLGVAGASFLIDPPAGDGLYGRGHATLGISAGRNGVIAYANAGDSYRALITAQIPIAGWTHLAMTCDAGRATLFLDGKAVAKGATNLKLHALLNATIMRPRLFEGDVAGLTLHRALLDGSAIARLAAEPLPLPVAPPAVEMVSGGLLVWQAGHYALGSRDIAVSGALPAMELARPWQVHFPPDLGAPAGITLDRLVSLHRHADFGVRHFSGTASYRTRFAVPASALGGDRRVWLDLGRVEVIARVVVNGKPLGALWKPPFRIDVTDAVRAGDNLLEVHVTNLWPNRLIGDEHLPAENQYTVNAFGWEGGIAALPDWYREGHPKPPGGRVAFTTWKHYAADTPLLASGLLGPVTLRRARLIALM